LKTIKSIKETVAPSAQKIKNPVTQYRKSVKKQYENRENTAGSHAARQQLAH